MSGDFNVSLDMFRCRNLKKTACASATIGAVSLAVGTVGKAASIFCPKGSIPKSLFSSVSSYGITTGILGLGVLGGAYFLRKSITEGDIQNQKNITKTESNNNSLKYYYELAKLKLMTMTKDVQQSIYIMFGWRH